MTHPTYSQTTLEALTITELKTIASQIGAIPDGDKRIKQTWVSAILDHQSKFSPAKIAAMESHIYEVMNQTESVPSDITEELTLTLLGLEVVDRETQTTDVIPHGDTRFWVHRGSGLLGAISTWGDRFVLTSGKSYKTLFEAVTSFIPRAEVALAYSDAEVQLRERFATAANYL